MSLKNAFKECIPAKIP